MGAHEEAVDECYPSLHRDEVKGVPVEAEAEVAVGAEVHARLTKPESNSKPDELPEEFLDDEAIRVRREQQRAVQAAASVAAEAAAAAGSSVAAGGDCKICCDEPRTHAAAPCGLDTAYSALAVPADSRTHLTCFACRKDVVMIIPIFDI